MITASLLLASFFFADAKAPKGATEISPGIYRVTEAGKVWIYRKTPFGYSKSEEASTQEKPSTDGDTESSASPFAAGKAIQSPPADSAAFTKATEDGDSVRFERPSPFGVYKWTRKKTELTKSEQEAWERSKVKKTTQTEQK